MAEQGGGKRTVSTCNELMPAYADGFYPSARYLHQMFVRETARCRALALVRDMKPATTSHFRDFKMTEDALDILPAGIVVEASCEFRCYQFAANEQRLAWSKLYDKRAASIRSQPNLHRLIIRAEDWESRVRLVARGDTDGDGFEDLVFMTRGIALEGTYDVTDVIVVGRQSASAVGRVLNPGRFLCPGYGCNLADARSKVSSGALLPP